MSAEQRGNNLNAYVTQVDISAVAQPTPPPALPGGQDQTLLLRQILQALDRNNELLEELVTQQVSSQRQRQNELDNWRNANPGLAQQCRSAAETLSRVHAEFLERLAEEVQDQKDSLLDGDFMFSEFVDRFGPRLAHLNGVLQVLSQLGSTANQS